MLPAELWNAQLSLLTGFVAARLMLRGTVGVLRTLPSAPEDAVRKLRRTARALGLDWPESVAHPDFIRALDPSRPADAAMAAAATSLLRGAAYAGRRARAYENAVLNLVEAETLKSSIGEQFDGVVIETEHDDERQGTVMLCAGACGDGPEARSLPNGVASPILGVRTGWPGDRGGPGSPGPPRKVRAPQDEVVGNTHPG